MRSRSLQRAYGLALCALALLNAPFSRADTLADAIAEAYVSNPTLQSQRYQLRSNDEDYVQALSGLRPRAELQMTGSYTRDQLGKSTRDLQRRNAPTLPDYTENNTGQAQIIIDQPLYTGGRVASQVKSADAEVRAGREALRAAEADVMFQVVQAYAAVRRDEEAIGIRRRNLDALVHQLAETRARKVAGEVTLTDVSQAEAQVAAERTLLSTAQAQLQASRAAYAAVVGRNPGGLEPEPPLPGLPTTVERAFDVAEEASPDLLQAKFVEEQTRARVAAARANNRPQVSLRGSFGYTGSLVPADRRNYDRALTAQAVITQPLFTGGLNSSIIRQELDRNASARVQIEAVRRNVVQNVSNAWNQMVTSRANVITSQEQVRAARIAFEGMQIEYHAGARATLDVLIAEQTLRDAELGLISARRDAYVGSAALLRAMGRLEARALITGLGQYDPAANLRSVERKGALPWDGVVRALDRVGRPGAGQRALEAPPSSGEPVKSAAPLTVVPADAPIVTLSPEAPLPGTVAPVP